MYNNILVQFHQIRTKGLSDAKISAHEYSVLIVLSIKK